MNKLLATLTFLYDELAPLLVFLLAERFLGLKEAILATLFFVIGDMIFRYVRRRPVTRLYRFVLVITVLFGILDLTLATPVFFRYEAVATNLLTAAFFAMTLVRGKPLIAELAEKRMPAEKAARVDIQDYLRLLTGIWTGYFLLKAGIYGYVSARYSAFRSTFGTVSLLVLLGGEQFFRPTLFRLCHRVGLVRPEPA